MTIRKIVPAFLAVAAIALLASCMQQSISVGRIIDRVDSHVKAELNLNAEQTRKLQELTGVFKEMAHEGQAGSAGRKAAMLDFITSPQLDQQKIRDQVKSGLSSSADKADAFLDRILPKVAAFHDSLSDAQREKAAALYSRMLDRMTE